MSIDIELIDMKKMLKGIDPLKVVAAARSAVNKMTAQAKTFASRRIRDTYNVPAGKLSKFLTISARASGDRIEAEITGRGRGLALSYFKPKQAGVRASKKTGARYTKRALRSASGRRTGGAVSVEVIKGRRKIVTGDPPVFLTVTKSGHVGVFSREGTSRLPIIQEFGPGVGGLFGSAKIMNATKTFITEKFEPIFTRELNYYLKIKG